MEQLAFEPMPGYKRLTMFNKRAKFLMRLAEDKRLLNLQEETLKKLADGNFLEYDNDYDEMDMEIV